MPLSAPAHVRMVYPLEVLAITAAHGVARARVNTWVFLLKRSPEGLLKLVNTSQELWAFASEFLEFRKRVDNLAPVARLSLQASARPPG